MANPGNSSTVKPFPRIRKATIGVLRAAREKEHDSHAGGNGYFKSAASHSEVAPGN